MCGVCVASSGNKIGAEGAKGLAEGLSSNSTLRELHLSGAYGGRGAGRGVGRRGSGRNGAGLRGTGRAQEEGSAETPPVPPPSLFFMLPALPLPPSPLCMDAWIRI